jgi:hypothetical protein
MIFMGASSCWALSAPWYTVGDELAQTVGQSPCVGVGSVEGDASPYTINVKGCTQSVAESLAAILIRNYTFGNVQLHVRVLGPSGLTVQPSAARSLKDPVRTVQNYFETALAQNPLFVAVHTGGFYFDLFIETKKEVVQFWNDNLADYYGNTNLVAADALNDVCQSSYFNNQVSVAWTTSLP